MEVTVKQRTIFSVINQFQKTILIINYDKIGILKRRGNFIKGIIKKDNK